MLTKLPMRRLCIPNLLHGWNGGANVGFSLTGGNSQTENLSLAFNAARATKDDKLSLYSTIGVWHEPARHSQHDRQH